MFAKSHGKLPLSFSKHRMPRRPSLITGRTGAQTGLAGHSGGLGVPGGLLPSQQAGPTGRQGLVSAGQARRDQGVTQLLLLRV